MDVKEIEQRLKRPFPMDDIHWRVSRAGKSNSGKEWALVLAYIDSRAIMDRLDEVFGIGGWQDDYEELVNGGFKCTISASLGERWVTKADGAPHTQVESIKGGFSDALKRTAVKWGMGRYLYNLTENFANINPNGRLKGEYKDNGRTNYFKYDPPELPSWAKPKPELMKDSKTYENVVDALESGKGTYEQVEERYFIPISMQKKLKALSS